MRGTLDAPPAEAGPWTPGPPHPLRRWLSGWKSRPDLKAVLFIVAVVIAGNLLYLTGVLDPNPIRWLSGLTVDDRGGLLPGWNTADPNTGFTAQALGHRAAIDLLHGRIPWWNPYEGVGTPLAGGMQGAPLFPLTLLLAFSQGQIYFYAVLELIAGLATYFLLRRLGVLRSVAAVGGAAFALNGTFTFFRYSAANPVAFLPVVLLGIEIAADPEHARRRMALPTIAIGVALSIYAGFPETAYIDGIFAGLWLIVRLVQSRHGQWARQAFLAVAGALTGLLLAAPAIIAFLDYLPHWTAGSHDTFAFAGLPRSGTPMVILPYVYGPIAGFSRFDESGAMVLLWGNVGGYITTSILLLAVIGLTGRRYRALRIAIATWSVLVILRTFTTGPSEVTQLFHLVPGFRQSAFYRYSQPTWEMGLIVLAALGLNDVLQGAVRRRWLLGATGLTAALIAGATRRAFPLSEQLRDAPFNKTWFWLTVIWALAIALAVGVAVHLHGARRARLLASVVVLDVMALFVVPQFSSSRNEIDTRGVAYLQRHLGTYRVHTIGPLAPNYGSYFGIASITNNDFPPKRWAHFIETELNANVSPGIFGVVQRDSAGPSAADEFQRNFGNYEEIGVRYLLVPPGAQLAPPGSAPLPTVHTDKAMSILELPNPKPYFEAPSSPCDVKFSNREKVELTCAAPARLVRRELYMPGWTARVNGRPAPIAAHRNLFQSVDVPPGRTTVTFRFRPPHLNVAVLAVLLGLAVIGRVAVPPPSGRRRS